MLLMSLVNLAIVVLVVIIHYEFLYLLNRNLHRLTSTHRLRIIIGVLVTLLAHTIEVWVFAIAYYYLNHFSDLGTFTGNFTGSLLDCVYFSFSTYTTLGFGDIEPHGSIRFLAGIEALTGLVLIAWTASFLYLEMQSNWEMKK